MPIFELRVCMKASQNTLWILRRFQPQFWAMPKTYCKSVAEIDGGQGWTRYKSSRCLYANCAPCTVSVQTRVDHRTRMYDGQRLAQDGNRMVARELHFR